MTLAVEQYLLRELSGPEREEFEEHFFGCPECVEAQEIGITGRFWTRVAACPISPSFVHLPELQNGARIYADGDAYRI